MKYYILRNNPEYECLNNEAAFEPYEELLFDFGIKLSNVSKITLQSKTESLPNSIPNNHQILIFDDLLQGIIRKFGVDCIQYFDIDIYNSKGKLISTSYKSLNILNVIDAIDFEKSSLTLQKDVSEFGDLGGNENDILDIKNLRLNYNNIGDNILFRLYGFETLVVVREDLAQDIVNYSCTGISFYDAEGFSV